MSATYKQRLAKLLLSRMLSRFRDNEKPFYRLLGKAISLQLWRMSDEDFRQSLNNYYAELDLEEIKAQLNLAAAAKKLIKPGGYKSRVVRLEGDSPDQKWRRNYTPWGRRFSLLGQLGINADVMILRRGDTVPPHGHHKVVSGFYVLDGEVAVRHYDRIEDFGDKVRVRKTIDTILRPRGYTTNSEFHDNIHWLQGLSDTSFLFRLNVKDTPTKTFGHIHGPSDRVYVDPTVESEQDGTILAQYIDESTAKCLRIQKDVKCAAL
jgi:hypothetical protein